jgi:hypothetical protein
VNSKIWRLIAWCIDPQAINYHSCFEKYDRRVHDKILGSLRKKCNKIVLGLHGSIHNGTKGLKTFVPATSEALVLHHVLQFRLFSHSQPLPLFYHMTHNNIGPTEY